MCVYTVQMYDELSQNPYRPATLTLLDDHRPSSRKARHLDWSQRGPTSFIFPVLYEDEEAALPS